MNFGEIDFPTVVELFQKPIFGFLILKLMNLKVIYGPGSGDKVLDHPVQNCSQAPL